MKILVIHHLEEMWGPSLEGRGTTFEEMAFNAIEHIEREEYDRVILTRFENHELGEEHYESGIAHLIDVVEVYSYGWCMDMVEQGCFPDNQKWCEGGQHSEIVLIDEWMERLKGHDVSICGAFDGECIEDLEIALSHLGIEFKRIEALIV